MFGWSNRQKAEKNHRWLLIFLVFFSFKQKITCIGVASWNDIEGSSAMVVVSVYENLNQDGFVCKECGSHSNKWAVTSSPRIVLFM